LQGPPDYVAAAVASQPVVTVTPASDGDIHRITDQDLIPPRQHHHHHQQQQQTASPDHPLAGLMRGRPQDAADGGQFRESDRPADRFFVFFFFISILSTYIQGGSVAEWLARWTQAQKGLGSKRSRDAVG